MKNILKTALFVIALTTCFMGYSRSSSADDTQSNSQTAPQQHRHHHGFRMGVCVGQTLSQQGITLSATPGDTTNRDAFKAAIQSCRAKFKSQAPATPAS